MNIREFMANGQTGLEVIRYIRDDAELNGRFSGYLRNGNYSEATILASRNISRVLPRVDLRAIARVLIKDSVNYMAIGTEATVVRDGANVRKYLTGKTENPEVLAPRLQLLHSKVASYIGEYIVPTTIDVVHTKLFKLTPATDYVRLTQPYLDIEHVDPHLDPDLLKSRPEIAASLRGMSEGMMDLFEYEGLIMDLTNTDNLVWGSHQENPKSQLYLLDTMPVDFGGTDFNGVHVPLWDPSLQLEYLADFLDVANPEWLDDANTGE